MTAAQKAQEEARIARITAKEFSPSFQHRENGQCESRCLSGPRDDFILSFLECSYEQMQRACLGTEPSVPPLSRPSWAHLKEQLPFRTDALSPLEGANPPPFEGHHPPLSWSYFTSMEISACYFYYHGDLSFTSMEI